MTERETRLQTFVDWCAAHITGDEKGEAQRFLWLKDNRTALDSSNSYVDLHGLPLAQHRSF